MKSRQQFFLAKLTIVLVTQLSATEFHVALNGKDSDRGTVSAPFRTIQRGADLAQPGDIITVHQGVYRERIDPPRGGDCHAKRIIYQAARGERVEIKGSEKIKGWVRIAGDVWKALLPNIFFGNFNPYADQIHGDWFVSRNRLYHTGAVYLNGEWLVEAASLDDVLNSHSTPPSWFALVDQTETAIWARFKGVDPNEQFVEINVRQSVFYPSKTGVNYLTVRGFIMRQAATPWAPPTAEQIGLVGTHWSKGWIIENNIISHSTCSGITLGKYGDEWDNRAGTPEGYLGTIQRALKNGWDKDTVGHHLVHNNDISHCEQAGIVGSLGCAFSTIVNNRIYDVHTSRLFDGAEMAGIKFHGAIDVQIRGNHIFRSHIGLWLDWMAQGARVSGNLFHENQALDLFVEVSHGPLLIDNNIFLSPNTLLSASQGSAYVHNLIAGQVELIPHDNRMTPFHKAHTTEIAGLASNPCGDDRYYNNVFINPCDLGKYRAATLPVWMGGNVFLNGATPSQLEIDPTLKPELKPELKLLCQADGYYLEFNFANALSEKSSRHLITTALLGEASIPKLLYEQPTGQPIRVDTDYLGRTRNEKSPTPGPFEILEHGYLRCKVATSPTLASLGR